MPTLQSFLDAVKLPPRYLAAIALCCFLLLIIPNSLAQTLSVDQFAQDYRQWIGITFIASLCLLAVDGCVKIRSTIRNRSRRAKAHERKLKRLHALTEEEKQILRFYVSQQSKTNMLRVDDGVVNGLAADGIIHMAARQGNILEGFAHNIDDFTWDYLHEHIELLEGTTNTYRTDKRERRW